MEDKVASLLFSHNTSHPVGALRIIRELGRSISEINSYFATSTMSSILSIVNIYSEVNDPVLQVS
jgi:AraC-like DNA-binding protein